MARAVLTVEFDGGSSIVITEQSLTAIYGPDGQAVQLAQLALAKLARAAGFIVEQPGAPPGDERPPTEQTPDGGVKTEE